MVIYKYQFLVVALIIVFSEVCDLEY